MQQIQFSIGAKKEKRPIPVQDPLSGNRAGDCANIVKELPLECTVTRFDQLCACGMHRYTCIPTLCVWHAPVHVCTNFVRVACTGTRFHQLCLDQSEIALKLGRAQAPSGSFAGEKPLFLFNHFQFCEKCVRVLC